MPDTATLPGWLVTALWAVFWCVTTLGLYALAIRLNRRFRAWWSSPLLVTWIACLALVPLLHSDYKEYLGGTWWLMALLGPATVAFALPIYEQRQTIRKHWPVLLVGVGAGSLMSVCLSWGLATLLSLSPELRASLLPRSITTAFAMIVAQESGGVPGLAATFTAITGLFGAAVGSILLRLLRVRSTFAHGALFGMGAHGAGVARAYQIGREEGSIASAVMVMAGLLNVVVAGVATGVMN